jgi:hypothetical protein
MNTDNIVSIMNAANFPVCFVAAAICLTVMSIKRAFQRSDDKASFNAHKERMESMRLAATKEVVARKNPEY